jgi:APA family basic amino acid/polyamine antiporter
VLFVALGLSLGTGSFAHLTSSHTVPAPATGWLVALIPIMFSYSGWNAAAYVAEEIRNPGKNVPIALALGTGAVVIYLALNLFLYALPPAELAGLLTSGQGLTDAVAQRLRRHRWPLLALLTIVSIAASISAMVLAGPRGITPWRAMACLCRRARPRASARRRSPSPRKGVELDPRQPARRRARELAPALWSCRGVAVMAVFVLRWREPSVARPFSAWGYPVAPAVFVLASLFMVGYNLYTNQFGERWGLAVIAAGLPLYFLFARPKKP